MPNRPPIEASDFQDIFAYAEEKLGLSKTDFSQLKTCLAGLGFAGGERHYQSLPSHLREHEIGQLMSEYVATGDPALIETAAKILFNNHPNWSLWLMH